MPPFRTVHGERAGPHAIGILVPPGSRTVVVLRPRALPVDLLLTQPGPNGEPGPGFLEAPRQIAGVEAQKLSQALVSWAEGGSGRVEAVPIPGGEGYWVQAELGKLPLIACPRIAGQPYRPMIYPTLEEARNTAAALTGDLCPAPDANQELYTNMTKFSR